MANGGTFSPKPEGIQPAATLGNRTYLALLAAQFLAAFNDQAIHASAMFFAINTQTLTEASAISLMPILFYAPWAIFCTLAGYLADRYSKRATLVFWKFAEIGITALAILGFWLGTHGEPQWGAWIVLSTVFLMGTHSAFFVPAKYGVMPEILQAHLLSKGNGLLESLSFLAVILGTVSGGVLSFLFLRQEYVIGIILFGLAVIGALASLMIRRMPAANPALAFPTYLYQPLFKSLRTLLSTRSLVFAVIGIAFFTFVVAFMRATVYMLGESQNPRWDELRTSVIVGTVALGIGLGSPLAGWLSGRKVELGLIPIGALGMVIGCTMAAFCIGFIPGLVAFIVLIGFSTGFYLVPLFTLLQHRAPKTSKGDMIATSNFINVTGAIIASGLFFILVQLARTVEFVEKVPVQDGFAAGELTHLDLERGRPVYFEVTRDNVVTAGGHRPDPHAVPPNVADLIFGSHRRKDGASPVILHVRRGIGVGSRVVVSSYRIGGVDHFRVRGENDELQPAYDAQHLPRFLFLGAGLMTLATLLVLWWRLPDLFTRAARVWRGMFGRRAIVLGIHNIPNDRPTILVTASSDPQALAAIMSASDRYTRFFSGDAIQVEAAARMLERGHMIGIVLDGPKGEEFLRFIVSRCDAELVPVFAGGDEQLLIIGFGELVPGNTALEDLRGRIERARYVEEH
jgi:MFS family permease